MEVAFRKNSNSIFSKLVRWWTKSQYSHCELVFTNGFTFSAYIEDFKTGFKSIEHTDDKWDIVKISITPEEEKKIYEWCMSEDNCKYDLIGIFFTQVLPLSFENPWWWFCSEVCCGGLQQVNLLPDIIPHEVDPGQFYTLLTERLINERIV